MPKSADRKTHAELVASMRAELETLRAETTRLRHTVTALEEENRAYRRPTPARAVEVMSGFVNSYSACAKEFAKLFAQEHRTLQQSFTRVALCWLWELSRVPDGHFDLRNAASVMKARELMMNQNEWVWRLPCV